MKDEVPGIRKIAPDVKLGWGVKISDFINLYGCEIGDNTKIGTFVEIQKGAKIGNNCKTLAIRLFAMASLSSTMSLLDITSLSPMMSIRAQPQRTEGCKQEKIGCASPPSLNAGLL